MKKKQSLAQRDRQNREYRSKGKYALVNPCYACGKSAGVDYHSHRLTDTGEWHDLALVLCAKCSDATEHMNTPDEFLKYKAKFGDESDKAWDKVCKQRGD